MKKVALFVVLFSMMTLSAKAQWFDFSQNMFDASIGLNAGAVGYHFDGSHIDKTYSNFGFGLSLSLVGVYADFIYQTPEHRWDRKITEAEYDDHSALTINVGYKVPVLPWLNVIPLIGYSNETKGRTLGNSIGVDSESNSIYHDYEVDERFNHFNYGLGLSVKPIQWLEIGGVCTAHAVYGNVSVNIMKLKD